MKTKEEEKKEKSKNSMSVYIPRDRRDEGIKEKIKKLAEEKDRSMNYLLMEAVDRYLEEVEKNAKGGD